MDTAILVVLPLVGGYIFASRWIVTKYVVDREDGHRLYFRAAFYGVFLFAVALLIRLLLVSCVDSYENFEATLLTLCQGTLKDPKDPSQLKTLVTSLYALGLGAMLWVPFMFLPNKWKLLLYDRAILGNDFEELIASAARRVIPIAATMENSKVYVGLLSETPPPSQQRKSLTILPLMSGFRHADTGEIKFTTYYNRIYDKLNKISPDLTIDDFSVVLPIDKIHSINMFDVVVYEEFQKQSTINRNQHKKSKKVKQR